MANMLTYMEHLLRVKQLGLCMCSHLILQTASVPYIDTDIDTIVMSTFQIKKQAYRHYITCSSHTTIK